MTYIELINAFWNKRLVYPLTSCEADFYMYLLKECNSRNWVNPFKLPTQIIERDLNLNRRTICEIRNKLQNNGYINFVASTRRGEITQYEIIDFCEDPYGNANRTQTERKPNTNRTQNVTQTEHYNKDLDLDKEISSNEDTKKYGRSVEERRKSFLDEVSPYIPKYGQGMVDAFCDYWTKMKDDTLMRFELEDRFSLSGRLATWHRNNMSRETKVSDISEKERLYGIDWDKVRTWYTGLGLVMSRWTEGRKRAYISIIDSYDGDMGRFKEAIIRFAHEVRQSDWILGLKGSPMRDFEWLFTEQNFVLVIDGKYRNNNNLKNNGRNGYDSRGATPAISRTPEDFDENDD